MKFSRLIFLFSVLVIAVVIAAAGMFFLSQLSNSQPTPNPNQSPTPASEIPEDWQTYRNDEFGFEVSYPNDLKLLREDPSTFVSFGKSEQAPTREGSLDIKVLRGVSEKEVLMETRIWTRDEIIQLQRNEPKQFPPDFNAEAFTETQEYWLFEPVNSYPTPVQEILVNGKKALVGEFDIRLGDTEEGYMGLGMNSKILLFGGNSVYALIYTSFNTDSVVLRQILSSFRFIE